MAEERSITKGEKIERDVGIMRNDEILQSKIWRTVLHWTDMINTRVGRIGAYLLIPLGSIIFFEVILRYVFHSPTIWAWDLSVQIYAAILMLVGGFTLLHKGHVSVDVFLMSLHPRKRALLNMINATFCFISTVVLISYGSIVAWESFEMGERMSTVWEPIFWPVKMTIPLGGFLLLIQGVANFVRDFATFRAEGSK